MDSSLLQFKSGGNYRLFVDSTVLPDLPSQEVRLLPGQFKTGPVNRAVYIKDLTTLHNIFGRRDKSLERAGCYSGLIAEQMLAIAPIVVLNLREFDDNDVLQRVSISSNVSSDDIDADSQKDILFTSVYDTTNFWKVEPLNLLQPFGTDPAQLLNISTVTNRSITFFVVPTTNTNYNYTVQSVQDRYPDMYVPSIKCTDLVSTYLVDIYMFENDFSNYERLAGHARWGQYFTAGTTGGLRSTVEVSGTSMSGAAALALETGSGYIGKVTGSLNRDLLDINGNQLSIETQINSVTDTTGVVCKINPEIIDMYQEHNSDVTARFMRSIDTLGANNVIVDLNVPKLDNEGTVSYLGATTSGSQTTTYPIAYDKMEDMDFTRSQFDADTFSALSNIMIPITNGIASQTTFLAPRLTLNVNDYFVGNLGQPVRLLSRKTVANYRVLPAIHTKELPLQANGEPFPQNIRGQWVYPQNLSWGGAEVEYETVAPYRPLDKPSSRYSDAAPIPMPTLTEVQIASLKSQFSVLKPLVEYVFDDELLFNGTMTTATFAAIDFEGNEINMSVIGSATAKMTAYRYTPRLVKANAFKAFYIKGAALRANQFVNGTSNRQNQVLNQLITGGNYRSLMDKTQLSWRYVIDAFKTYVEGNAKYQFAKICKDSKRAIAISSLPTKYALATSTDPYFKYSATSPLAAEYMATGGNTELAHSRLFSFAGQDYGAPYITYIANVRFNDGIDDMTIPATGMLSNAFMRKYTESGKYPFDIVAGSDWPLSAANVSDIDHYVSQGQGSDLDYLEPASWNMLMRDNTGNITLLSSRTAQTSFFSAFTFVENIELLIYIADNLEPYLDAKRYKRNTPNARLEVKTKADMFMTTILNAGGILSFTTTCDTTNNDEETINRGFIILDVTAVNSAGITITVQRIELRLAD